MVVNVEDGNCSSPDGRSTNENWSVPAKMPAPFLAARIEQRHEFSGACITSGDVWSLEAIAVKAGQGQIVGNR